MSTQEEFIYNAVKNGILGHGISDRVACDTARVTVVMYKQNRFTKVSDLITGMISNAKKQKKFRA